jgi:hypothetical protein
MFAITGDTMFNKKTVLVMGAGGSQEVNLPTGKELKGFRGRSLKRKKLLGVLWSYLLDVA